MTYVVDVVGPKGERGSWVEQCIACNSRGFVVFHTGSRETEELAIKYLWNAGWNHGICPRCQAKL